MKKLITVCAIVIGVAGWVSTAAANFDPDATPPAPILDAGWFYDQVTNQYIV